MAHAAHMGNMRNLYETVARKPEGKKTPGGSRHKWLDNLKI
jgi:hypothetical protein